MQFKDYPNFHQLLCETVDTYANDPAYRWFDKNANASSVTWQQFYDQAKSVSKSLKTCLYFSLWPGAKVSVGHQTGLF